ncbi:MAG: ATP-binding protein [Paracoccaceae bacterium]
MNEMNRPFRSHFFEQKYFIPFGRFRIDRILSDSDSATFVGREGQRAFLIDALTGAGKRGAYLVTGRRGVGKTTFVENCLHEYDANVFRRFLRSNIGRSVVDLAIVAGVAALLIWILLSASDLLEFLIHQNARHGGVLVVIPLALAFSVVAMPATYGFWVLKNCARSISPSQSVFGILSLLVGAVLLAAGLWLPVGSPTVFLVGVSVVFAIWILLAYLFSYASRPPVRGSSSSSRILWQAFVFAVLIALLIILHYLCLGSSEPEPYRRKILQMGQIILPSVMTAIFLGNAFFYWRLTAFLKQVEGFLDTGHASSVGKFYGISNPEKVSMASLFHLDRDTAQSMYWKYLTLPVLLLLAAGVVGFFDTLKQIRGSQADWAWEKLWQHVSENWGPPVLIVCSILGIALAIGARKFHSYTKFCPWEWQKCLITKALTGRGTASGPAVPAGLCKRKRGFFVPPIEGLLLFKGVVLICLSLQLAYPLMSYSKDLASSCKSKGRSVAKAATNRWAKKRSGSTRHFGTSWWKNRARIIARKSGTRANKIRT